MTDRLLQLALANMLSEKLEVRLDYLCPESDSLEKWQVIYWSSGGKPKETEWLAICALIEVRLTAVQRDDYYYSGIRKGDKELDHAYCVSASWQERAAGLAKVFGIEL